MILLDMDMPKSCAECRLLQVASGMRQFCKCLPDGRYFDDNDKEWMINQRPNWCPLKEQEPLTIFRDGVGTTVCRVCGGILSITTHHIPEGCL